MIKSISKIIGQEIDILKEITMFVQKFELSKSPEEKRMLKQGINSLVNQLKDTNRKIPDILNEIILEKKDNKKRIKNNNGKIKEKEFVKPLREKEKVLKELEIGESLIRKVRQKKKVYAKEEKDEFKEARGYLKLSNKFFLEKARNMMKKGYFASLPSEIKKSNIDILSETYVAMILFSTFLSVIIAVIAVILFLAFGIEQFAWLPLLLPIFVFITLYKYPSAERKAIANKIDDELPFAVIHMSSISGSGIAPTEIFKIIGLSKEYPYLRKEIRKILNQINIYGYDLVTALNNVSKATSSSKLAELLNGLSATINSGGNLSEFFAKRAETLMMGYKLEKEKFIKVAETFMDIYIAVVIAAPMILMLLLVMISISGIQTGFSPIQLTFITIAGVALINIIFLVFLQTRQAS
ncbi:MAG: type II secretion system F family protein [Candidatus Pacearchaeota archaeon]